MKELRVDQQQHGYLNGHQLLAASTKLARSDQDVIDRLSDMAGPLGPGETFKPYLTAYPLPGGQHYIVARTWQDMGASRAGCVLTRSLIIPMADWADLEDLSGILDLLLPVNRSAPVLCRETVEPIGRQLPPVSDPRAWELVEALFLESRQPTVMFEAPEAEELAQRLLTAFWPGLRRTFCLCTFALSPRTIAGRPFDLLFAPKSARNRFSEWHGRRIDVQNASSTAPRHRWTSSMAQQIFLSDKPNLLKADALGALRLDDRGDESALRLSLLWNELEERSESVPTAVLGMLDILNSRDGASKQALEGLSPLIERAVRLASASLPSSEVWQFLVALHGKYRLSRPTNRVLKSMRLAATSLAKDEHIDAFELLKQQENTQQSLPPILSAGLGDGIAHVGRGDGIMDKVAELRPDTGLQLVGFSRPFAKALMLQTNEHASQSWVKAFKTILDTTDRQLRKRARRHVVPYLRNSAHANLLAPLLKDVDASALSEVVQKIWLQTRFRVREFDDPLWHSARDKKSMAALRSVIVSVEETSESNRFLRNTLGLNGLDIEWLCGQSGLERRRVAELLNCLIVESDDRTVQSVIHDSDVRDHLFETLLADVGTSAPSITRLLTLGKLPLKQFLYVGLEVYRHLSHADRRDLAVSLLSRSLAEANVGDDELVAKVVADTAAAAEPRQLVAMAVPPNTSAGRISSNLVIFEQSAASLRNEIVARIDDLTHRLVSGPMAHLSAPAYYAWASMLHGSQNAHRNAHLRSATEVLPNALRMLKAPISPLVVSAFPTVYAGLKAGNDFPHLFSILLFAEVDQQKKARQDLVDAYFYSSWPPADLLLIAVNIGNVNKILNLVRYKRDGNQYMQSMESDLVRFDEPSRTTLLNALSAFRSAPPSFRD